MKQIYNQVSSHQVFDTIFLIEGGRLKHEKTVLKMGK